MWPTLGKGVNIILIHIKREFLEDKLSILPQPPLRKAVCLCSPKGLGNHFLAHHESKNASFHLTFRKK